MRISNCLPSVITFGGNIQCYSFILCRYFDVSCVLNNFDVTMASAEAIGENSVDVSSFFHQLAAILEFVHFLPALASF